MYALLAVAAVAGLMWVAGLAAGTVTGAGVPTRGLEGVVELLATPGAPGSALGNDVGTAAYWFAVVLLLAIVAAVAGIVWRRTRGRAPSSEDVHSLPGLATGAQVRSRLGARAVLAQTATLRPSLAGTKPHPSQVGYLVGRARGVDVYVPVEHSMVLVGPARQGKGVNVVLPMICEAPGAVVSTSVRTENAIATWSVREATGGPMAVFDPAGVAASGATPLPAGVRWSLDRGCEDPNVAMMRARALAANSGKGVENADFWAAKAVQALAPLLHAAALEGGGVDALYRWSESPARARDAHQVLDAHPRAARGWADALGAIITGGDPRTTANMWAQVEQALLMPLMLPTVRDALSPAPGQSLDLEDFIARRGTLYVISDDAGSASGIIAALVEDVYTTAYRIANRSPGNRLDPPLLLALDELANIAKLPSLGAMISAGGGAGITTLAVLQSLSQARDRWGAEAAGAIWGSATTKVVLGGLAEDRDLSAISALLGEHSRVREQVSESRSGGPSRSWSHEDKRVMTPGQVRSMPKGTALLISGSNPVALLDLLPVWERPYRSQIGAGPASSAPDVLTDWAHPTP